MSRSEATFRGHPIWRGSSQEVLDQAVEGLEKYLMSKLWPRTFAVGREDRDRDERYVRLATALAFVDLSTLMGQEVVPEEALVAAAQAELLKMDKYKAPRDKLLCLVNVKTLVENIVGAAARGGAQIGGADAFFPVFLLVVIRARMPRLASNVEYVRRFRAAPRLSGQFDYMLCNLESAAVYLDTVDWKHLKVSEDEFLARLSEAGIPEAEMELRARRAAAAAAEEAAAAPDLDAPLKEEAAEVAVDIASAASLLDGPTLLVDPAAAQETEEEEASSAAAAAAAPVPLAIQLDLLSESPAVHDSGLTPLGGAAPQTPVLLKKQRPSEPPAAAPAALPEPESPLAVPAAPAAQPSPPPPAAAPAPSPAPEGAALGAELPVPDLIRAMIDDGTALVLAEEAEGRLQARHPWVYAAAEDLTAADVRGLLASYRDVVLKYEALSLVLQQQVGSTGAAGDGRQGSLLGAASAGVSSTAAAAAGALMQRFASWGRASAAPVEADGSEHAAALQGKSGDATLLHSLFGSPHHSASRRATKPGGGGGGGEGLPAPGGAAGAPQGGTQPAGGPVESLI